MNLSDLTRSVASATNTSEADAKSVISAMFEQIADAAAKGEEVAISRFGKFTVKGRAERPGRNPSTGQAITIAASKKMSFAPAKALKDKL